MAADGQLITALRVNAAGAITLVSDGQVKHAVLSSLTLLR